MIFFPSTDSTTPERVSPFVSWATESFDAKVRKKAIRRNARFVFMELNFMWLAFNNALVNRLLRLKWLALDEGVDKFADGKLLVFGSDQDFIGEFFIGETKRPT